MKNYKSFFKLSLGLAFAFVFAACEGEEESISLTPGTELLISGSDEVLTYSSTEYFVRGHNIDEDYTWTITGSGEASVAEQEGRYGEFVDVLIKDVGTYTLTVSSTNGLDGTFEIEVEDVNEFIGVSSDTSYIYEESYLAGSDTLFFPITISERNVDSTAVEFEVVNGTAIEGIDFKILNDNNVLGFSAGQTEAFIKILTMDNITEEAARDFRIVLGDILLTGDGTSAVTHAPDSMDIGQAVIYIEDDVKTVNLIVDFDEIDVNEAGNYFINLSLNRPVSEDVIVNYSIDGLPILSDADKTNGSVTIFAGNTSGEIVLDIDPSWIAEGEDLTVLDIELESIVSDDEEVSLGTVTEYRLNVGPEEE